MNGTGLSITSNPVDVIVPGTTSDFVWSAAPGQSQYFYSIELLTGTPGSTVRLPFVPNSMVMDQVGVNLYFGSPRELMVYSTNGNTLTKQDPSFPAWCSPFLQMATICSSTIKYVASFTSTTSPAASSVPLAAWVPQLHGRRIRILFTSSIALRSAAGHTNTLYVHDANSGWSTYDLSASGGAQNLAVTVPGLGAWLAGNPTVAHTWCPSGTVGNNATIQFYPQPSTDSLNIPTNVLGATSDGQHILGASLNGSSITLDDIGLNIPPSLAYPAR